MQENELAEYCMGQIVPFVDLIIANEEDTADIFGIKAAHVYLTKGKIDATAYISVAKQLSERFPKASQVAITLRESISASHNNWGALLFDRISGQAHFAPLNAEGEYSPYKICDIVDRVGSGDSFGAGLIHALYSDDCGAPENAIRFAVAASCLKHSVKGDFNYINRSEVLSLMNGDTSGRVKR